MDHKKLGERLRNRREKIGWNQHYLGVKVGVDQSTICLLEKGELKFTDQMLKKIKTVEGFEDFDKGTPDETVNDACRQTIAKRWRWGKPSFYLMITLVSLFFVNEAVKAGDDLYKGINVANDPNEILHVGIMVVFISLIAWLIYWAFWKKKW